LFSLLQRCDEILIDEERQPVADNSNFNPPDELNTPQSMPEADSSPVEPDMPRVMSESDFLGKFDKLAAEYKKARREIS
jgi:hypothetical protein